MTPVSHLAIDLGASSGRAMLGFLGDDRLELVEVHRFENRPCRLPDGLHWDLPALLGHVVEGIGRGAAEATRRGVELRSVGVDTWGVDYGLLSASGELVGLPRCYRDERSGEVYAEAIGRLGAERVYDATGIQLMPINTLYQLAGQVRRDPGMLQAADRLLFMPDLFHYLLGGEAAVEATIASTSQMLDVRTGAWATSLLETLDVPTHLLGEPVAPGTRLGRLRGDLAERAGGSAPGIIAPASHDTASAVAAVPADPATSWCFLSSGTWSLLGAELTAPCVTAAARAANFTNELGLGGSVRFLRNITGLWILQECRRALAADGVAPDWAALTAQAAEAPALRTIIDASAGELAAPGDMPARVRAMARRIGEPEPSTPGELARCCLDSLALQYRLTLRDLERVLDRRFDVVHVVGGGGRNELLARLTADATGRTVVVGPYEATAMGNLLVQALGAAAAEQRGALRDIVRASTPLRVYEPRDAARWDEAEERLERIASQPLMADG